MGLYLIGFSLAVLKVAVGLGMVIFVHELGHFLVAKLCGVKCEKFYLGFDIGGWKFCKFTWGETEYGIGILPLGGYVKMLGQEDNPARLQEELERAKSHGKEEADTENKDENRAKNRAKNGQDEQADTETVAEAEAALYDPRSFLAQSVPKRMAIISAGVVMNVIFAFVMAAIAYGMGVKQMPCGVGALAPGQGAWQADLKVDDRIVEIAGKPVHQFRDLQTSVSLGDIDGGISLVIRRPGVQQELTATVMPDRTWLVPRIGISNPRTTSLLGRDEMLWSKEMDIPPVGPGSPADLARPRFHHGDRIVEIGGSPVDRFGQIRAQLTQHPDEPLSVTVERAEKGPRFNLCEAPSGPLGQIKPGPFFGPERITIEVAPRPMKRLGLVMEMGPVTAVQDHSPAARAGIKPGDRIEKIDGRTPGDPMTLPDRLRKQAGGTVTLTIRREGTDRPIELGAALRQPMTFEVPIDDTNWPVTANSLGIAYRVENRVERVISGSPAAAAGVKVGDVLTRATLLPPDEQTIEKLKTEYEKPQLTQTELALDFSPEKPLWPILIAVLQSGLPGTRVEFDLKDGRSMTLKPYEATDWFNPERGFRFEAVSFDRKASSPSEAVELGAAETIESMTLVLRMLHKVGTQQVSAKAFGGPVEIAKAAYRSASRGTARLLLFLTLLSANLAVLNFLPIPLLDGGHMVFLVWEGIRGKPANERVQVVLTYLGLAFILGLMVWVIGLDFGLISRQ